MMPDSPLVSIIMPTYNYGDFIGQAIESVMAQEMPDFELIVSDNASDDGTEELVRALAARDSRIRYFRNESNFGLTANFNLAVERTHPGSRYLILLPSDDWWSPQLLSTLVAAAREDPDATIIHCDAYRVDRFGTILNRHTELFNQLPEPGPHHDLERLFHNNFIPIPGTLIDRGHVRDLYPDRPLFDPDVPHTNDYHLWLQLMCRGATAHYIPEPLLYLRKHERALTIPGKIIPRLAQEALSFEKTRDVCPPELRGLHDENHSKRLRRLGFQHLQSGGVREARPILKKAARLTSGFRRDIFAARFIGRLPLPAQMRTRLWTWLVSVTRKSAPNTASADAVATPTRRSSAVSNGLWNGLSRISLGVAQILGSILIVRGLNAVNPEAYGTFSYYSTLAGILATLGVLAFPTALTKVGAELRGRDESEEIGALVRWLGLGLGVANLLIAVGIVIFALSSQPPLRNYLLIVALVPLFHVGVRLFSSTLMGFERYRPISIASTAAGIVQLILIVAAFVFDWGISGYLIAVVLSINIVIPLVLAFLFRDRLGTLTRGWTLRIQRTTVRRYLGFAVPATIIAFTDTIVNQRSEIVFLERLSTIEEIGFYNLGFSIFIILLGLGLALINGYFPALSRDAGAGDWKEIRHKFAQGTLLVTLFATPFVFGSWAALEPVISLMFGSEMLPAVPVAQILMLSLWFMIISGLFVITIQALDGIWKVVPVGLITSVINIGLNLLLIPDGAAIGAAISYSVTAICTHGLLVLIVRRTSHTRLPLPWGKLAGTVVLGAFSTFALPKLVLALLPGTIGGLVAIALAAIAYGLLVWGFGLLEPLGILNGRSRPHLERIPTLFRRPS